MPILFSPSRPYEVMELDYISIGRLEYAGMVEPLGAGFYALNDAYIPDDVTAFLVEGKLPPRYVTHVTFSNSAEDVFTGTMPATLHWLGLTSTRLADEHGVVVAHFTTGQVIAEETEQGIRDKITGRTS